MVDLRLVVGALSGLALLLALTHHFYPSPLRVGTRIALDGGALVLLAGAVVLLLQLIGRL